MSDQQLILNQGYLMGLRDRASATVNPFQKAKIAEEAVSVAVDIISELVTREIKRGDK